VSGKSEPLDIVQ